VLSRLGRYEDAAKQFRAALSKQPNLVDAHVNLGIVLLPVGRFEEAEGCFRRALILKATDLRARTQLGLTFVQLGRLDSARAEFDKVLRIAPRHADALFGMGTLARSEGRFAEAEELFRRALVADPQMSRAWAALAGIRKMTSADPVWLKRAQQTAAALKSPHDEAEVRYAIGKYFDDLGKYPQAFESYRQANELLKKVAVPYDAQAHAHFVHDLTQVYTPQSLARAAENASDSDVPIFVVGMPRSGTSLLEQILASHPAVGGAGELSFWSDVVRRREAQVRKEIPSADERRRMAQEYLGTLAQRCPGAQRVVDKTPLNADHLGLIHSVFPRARIIYMQRDPLDTGLSCYFQHFVLGLSWSLDLSDIARYYTEHRRLYWHWRAALPAGAILEVPYEELVSNQEAWTRTVLEFAGLDWDERCLQFHRTERAVVTSSYWQVRQSMYRDSVHRWRHYSKFIGPLRKLQSG
jgi:tetratricopeptide (TPR) repeat protein